ncbi:uncharacterized protein LOC123547288 [Mercenaria mercenaria]|uniref:uncharacterized protein LOC123547288 n=1 Tax=Mercenaria mercenaria TaxID=6596 RepID=UPI00234EEFEE|nr:uncharacterized protein LOC123547288 [Mercenaria mercenaria]
MAESDRGISSLQPSIYKGSADDFDHSCGQCIVDGHEVEAHGFCADCHEYLCVTCFRAHCRNKASRHHKLLGNDALSNVRIAQVSSEICTEKCSVHINEIVKFFCSKHEALCCNDCVILNHRNCEIDYIPETCSSIEESAELRETLQELDTTQKTSDNIKIAAQKIEGELDSSTETVIKDIRVFEQELHEHIVKLRKKVESEVETRRSTNKQIVKSVIDTCDKMSSNMDQLRKGMLDSKKERNLAQLYIAIKRSKNALKSEKLNESIKMLSDTRTRFQFERSVDIETLQEKTLCLGALKDTGYTCRDAIINRSKNKKMCCTVLYVGSSHMTFGFSVQSDPQRMFSMTWCVGGIMSNKVPTSLLINPDGKSVCAFGYEADQKYNDLVVNAEEENFFYFRGDYILSMFRDMDEKRTFVLDVSGKQLPSIVILSTLIRVLKDEAFSWIRKSIHILEDDVYFVITVPERFETSRDAMEEAVLQAGIDSGELTIAFETEAAFMYIQDDSNYKSGVSPVKQFRKGTRFLVLDARAKLFTTTVYEVCGNKSTQLYHEAVESCGGDSVREEIEKFMSTNFGHDIMQKFMTTCPEDYRDMMSSIHERVSVVKTQKNHPDIRNVWAYKLFDFVQEHTGGTVKDLLCKQTTEGKIKVSGEGFGIDSSIWIQFFQRSISTIASHIHSILQDKAGLGCTALVMIGGFSNSPILQNGLGREFPDLQVIGPNSPENAVILGANALGI